MSHKEKIIIIGARIDGHAGVVLDLIELDKKYDVVGFIDNTIELQGTKIKGIEVLGSTDALESLNLPTKNVHIAIGDNVARKDLLERIKKINLVPITLIHPSAVVSKNAKIGEGSFIGARAIVNNGTQLGNVVIINSGAIVEHDNIISTAVHMAPGTKTAGRVIIEECAFIGVGATILPDIKIGSCAMIGAGSTVVKNVSSKVTVIGYAAQKHDKNIYFETDSDVANKKVYVAQPTLPDYELLDSKFRNIANSLMLSNFAKYSTELEMTIQSMLCVDKALTFPNATSALMLIMKAMELKGEVILPSFTFSATGHAVVWNGLTPVLADIERDTFNIDPDDVEAKITDKTCAIIGVHCFGNPANIERLESIAKKHNLKLIFDSAHALGSTYKGKPIGGFGDVECFSLSGTKVVTSAEGGIITSNDNDFIKKMHIGRNYGASSDYDCQYIGLNGKMSEFHAAIALESMELMSGFVQNRNDLVKLYIKRLGELPGLSFQNLPDGHMSTFKDFAMIVDEKQFGLSRDKLIEELNKEGIYPKKYFFPLHRMKAYEIVEHRAEGLTNTEFVADNIICLPIFSHMSVDTLEKICYAVLRIYLSYKK